jgi:hypothetical protein
LEDLGRQQKIQSSLPPLLQPLFRQLDREATYIARPKSEYDIPRPDQASQHLRQIREVLNKDRLNLTTTTNSTTQGPPICHGNRCFSGRVDLSHDKALLARENLTKIIHQFIRSRVTMRLKYSDTASIWPSGSGGSKCRREFSGVVSIVIYQECTALF